METFSALLAFSEGNSPVLRSIGPMAKLVAQYA